MSASIKIRLIQGALFAVFGLSMSFSLAAKKSAVIGREDTKNCENINAPPKFEGNFCESLSYIRPKLTPLNDSKEILGRADVVFFGDTHPNVLIKKWLARNLQQMKAAGFTHIALEALNSESQNILDGYLKKSISRAEMTKLIADDWGWIPEEHVKLIDAIQAAGLKAIAIDNRNELDRGGFGNDIQKRNDHMSDQIENTLSERGAGRVAVLTGKLHSSLVSSEAGIITIPEILNRRGISNLSYDLESTEEFAPKSLIQAFMQELSSGRLAASSAGDYFMPTPVEDSSVHGVIFISR